MATAHQTLRMTSKKIILSFKRAVRPHIWNILSFYERTFGEKGKKAAKFDKIVKEHQIYFTTNVNTEGLTDQLTRLIFFYKVGMSLGMKYYYTPLKSQRSSYMFTQKKSKNGTYSDVYDFLGVNEYLKKISTQITHQNFEEIIIDLDEINFTRRDRDSFSNLIFFLKALLAESMPLIINLYYENQPNIEYLGIEHSWPGVLFVDLNNVNMEEIVG